MPLRSSVANHIVHPGLADHLRPHLETLLGKDELFGESITLRRGSTTLPLQKVRISSGARRRATERNTDGAQQNELTVLVVGPPTLDIKTNDRFNDANGSLYEVYFVRPNRQIQTAAEARMLPNG